MGRCDPAPDRVDSEGRAYKGSMLQLQAYVNRRAEDLDSAIRASISGVAAWPGIRWVSPRQDDSFREYFDDGFLRAVGLSETEFALRREFWPRNGPCWDGLAVSTDDESGCLIVEAKSYPREAETSTGAQGASLQRIKEALEVTASWLGVDGLPDAWWDGYYQAGNRLAYLYFLREMCEVDAYLVFACFVNDPTHNATTSDEWSSSFERVMEALGLESLPDEASFVLLSGVERSVLTEDN